MPLKCKETRKVYHIAYYEANKERVKAQTVAYKEANKERIKAQNAAYREANKERIKAYSKSYYQVNKEKRKDYYEANKEKRKAYTKAYTKANKEKHNARYARRKALKINQIPIKVRDCPTEKKRLYQAYKLRALFTKITGVQHHVDHMWPLSDGGPHWSGNLQIITATENLSKKDRVEPSIKATIQEMLKDIKDAY